MDSNGCTSAFLEERLNMGLNFILSAEVSLLVSVEVFNFYPQQFNIKYSFPCCNLRNSFDAFELC